MSGIRVMVIFVILQSVECANILFVSTIPSVSHHKTFRPIWKELSLRGHNVHVVSALPSKDPNLTNLTEYDLSSLLNIMDRASESERKLLAQKVNLLTAFYRDMFMAYGLSRLHEVIFRHEEMQRLLRSDVKFDVVIAEWVLPTMGALAAKYGCPLIGITSSGAPVTSMDSIGNPSHPVISPDHILPVTRSMSFQERVASVLYSIYVRLWHHLVVLPREDRLVRKYLGDDLPYLGDIEKNVSVLLLNRNLAFHRVIPTVPTVIQIGSVSLNRTKPKLDPKLQRFLDNSKQGAIYFSLGSALRATNLSKGTRKVLLDVFSQLPFNIVFKWELDVIPQDLKNVYFSKWFPQLTMLGHHNVKLFLTQGGLQSSEETILAEVPIIGFPMMNDQTANVDTFVRYGAGISLDMDRLTVDELNSSIYEIMTNPSYKENAKILASIAYDQQTEGVEQAVWWIEYVIRHKGARHLRSPILDIPWWQYFMLDVIGFLLVFLSTNLLLFYLLSKGFFILVEKIGRDVYPTTDVVKKIK